MIACPQCRTILPADIANTGELHECPSCTSRIRADLFNAFHRPIGQGKNGELVQAQGQAECFYHPGKKAVTPCSSCGRLLCALCEISIDGRCLCTNCLQSGRDKQQIKSLERSCTLYDSIALHLSFWPLVFFPFTLITAPAVIYVVLRYWSAAQSILPRTKFRHILALLLAGGQMAGWVFFFVGVLS